MNTGLFSALVEQKIVEWVSVGHDHDNDYYGLVDGIYLAYGRKTGYGNDAYTLIKDTWIYMYMKNEMEKMVHSS